jgi:hypothetical protein
MSPFLPLEPRDTRLADRILDCFPAGTYALSALLRLLEIAESEAVPTAAVECRAQPRLLVNPRFVERHAATTERLLMLVMHELHHVLLGHTTLFPTVTPVQNFVFDAVINGIVSRMFPARPYTAFLTDYYTASAFPVCLLRPPPGWPERPRTAPAILALGEPASGLIGEIHAALYSETGASYHEVFDVLPKLVPAGSIEGIPLIGGHGEDGSGAGALEVRSPVLFDVVRSIVEHWPQPPDPIRGRSLADVLKASTVRAARLPSNRTLLRRAIRKVAGLGAAGSLRQMRLDRVAAPTPIPALDRRSAVLRALGHQPLLHYGAVPWRRVIRAGGVHVYMDVSGSMEPVKNALYGAVLDCREHVHGTIHLFSTAIADISLDELRRGISRSTGGTDIACVARHMSKHRIRRALILTDGWVGAPRGAHRDTLAKAKLAVAYLGATCNMTDLASVADYTNLSAGACTLSAGA